MTLLVLAALLAAPGPTVSKTKIPYADEKAGPPDLIEAIQSRRPGGKLLNLDRMLLNSPNFTKGWNTMFAAIRNQLSLPANLREIAILRIGVLNNADYEWIQHEPEFLKAGGTRQQLDALKQSKIDDKLWSEPERAALRLTDEMTKDVKPKQETVDKVRALIGDQKTVELMGTIAGYNMVSRFVVATGLEAEQ
jgi:alkylhydroperoxidase family enzyme